MRVAVVCYALVLRSAALRDEISRFEPLELEVADEKMHQEALMTPTSPETAANSTADHQPEAFLEVISSANCIDGTLHLRGQNVVNSALVFSKECATLRGDMGAQVTLQEPLIFEGDLRMEGDIRFIAASFFFEPCVEVKGSASMFGNIHFEGCHNKAHNKWHAGGGGLMVKKLTQHAGAIAFHNCSSEDHGGGLYVIESIAQNNGTMAFSGCSSTSAGGGLYVSGYIAQNNGTMAFSNCWSRSVGGGLFAHHRIMQNNGTMAFSNCSSGGHGGGLFVWDDIMQNHGTMDFSSCSSDYGGGLYVNKSMVQNNGTMEFSSCSSGSDGGGLFVARIMQNNGTMAFSNCSSGSDGGGIYVSDVTQNGGVMEFSNCRSQGDDTSGIVTVLVNVKQGESSKEVSKECSEGCVMRHEIFWLAGWSSCLLRPPLAVAGKPLSAPVPGAPIESIKRKEGTTNQEAGTLFQGTQRMPSAQNKTPWKSQLGFTSSPLETSAAKRQM